MKYPCDLMSAIVALLMASSDSWLRTDRGRGLQRTGWAGRLLCNPSLRAGSLLFMIATDPPIVS
jgi:hypothetical protein